MKISDLHCDSIQNINKGKNLINTMNFSKDHFQIFALFVDRFALADQKRMAFDEISLFKSNFDGVFVSDAASFEKSKTASKSGMLSLEGMAFVDSIATLEKLYAEGVRFLMPTWNNSSRIAASNLKSGTADDYGITDFGKEILSHATELGMVLDVSHISDRSFFDLASLSPKPFIASHSNARSICGKKRNLTDEQIKEIIAKNGLIGINIFPPFISEKDDFNDIFRHIEHILLLGGEDVLSFGFDIDGTDGCYFPEIPRDASIHEFIISELSKHYPDHIIEKIAFLNASRFIEAMLR